MLHMFVPHFYPCFKYGGPVKSIALLDKKISIERTILTSNRSFEGKVFDNKSMADYQKLYNVRYLSFLSQILYILFRIKPNDTVYLNSFFHFKSSILTLVLMRLFKNNVRIYISPRGELFDRNLRTRQTKKSFYIFAYMKLIQRKNIVFISSNKDEACAIKACLTGVKIDIMSNLNDNGLVPRSINSYSKSNQIRLVFLSRISPKKNLETAIKVINKLGHKMGKENVIFDVYGPAADIGYLEDLQGSSNFFNYCGEVQPLDISSVLSKYDCLLFPSFTENFGHVISESMRAGLYIATSQNTPWDILDDKGKTAGFRAKPEDVDRYYNQLVVFANFNENLKYKCGLDAKEMISDVQRNDAELIRKYENIFN